MKKSFNKKHLCLTAAAIALTATLSVGSAMAYFTTYATASGGVELSLGSTTIIPGDDVSNWTKHVSVQNTGEYECYVRVKALTGEEYQDKLTFSDESGKWTPGADGYYYYSDIVQPGTETEQLHFNFQSAVGEEDDVEFNIIIVQECTLVSYDENGEPYADWNVIADSSENSYTGDEEVDE
ncbi:MAG: hypothetical protein KH828_05905 [Clostridiales bacterium]|nr:hypothetical protein [Clostridiales bacterium]